MPSSRSTRRGTPSRSARWGPRAWTTDLSLVKRFTLQHLHRRSPGRGVQPVQRRELQQPDTAASAAPRSARSPAPATPASSSSPSASGSESLRPYGRRVFDETRLLALPQACDLSVRFISHAYPYRPVRLPSVHGSAHADARGHSEAPAAATATITLSGTATLADKGTYQEHAFEVPPASPASTSTSPTTTVDRERSSRSDCSTRSASVARAASARPLLPDGVRNHAFVLERSAAGGHVAVVAGHPVDRCRTVLQVDGDDPRVDREHAADADSARFCRRQRPGMSAISTRTRSIATATAASIPVRRPPGAASRGKSSKRRGPGTWTSSPSPITTPRRITPISPPLQEGLTSMLLLRGQELTTFHGHANVYGTSRPIDFRLGFKGRTDGHRAGRRGA